MTRDTADDVLVFQLWTLNIYKMIHNFLLLILNMPLKCSPYWWWTQKIQMTKGNFRQSQNPGTSSSHVLLSISPVWMRSFDSGWLLSHSAAPANPAVSGTFSSSGLFFDLDGCEFCCTSTLLTIHPSLSGPDFRSSSGVGHLVLKAEGRANVSSCSLQQPHFLLSFHWPNKSHGHTQLQWGRKSNLPVADS